MNSDSKSAILSSEPTPPEQPRSNALTTYRETLWDLEAELNSYSVLLRNLGECELRGEDLYGLGLALDRVRKRLVRLSERISR